MPQDPNIMHVIVSTGRKSRLFVLSHENLLAWLLAVVPATVQADVARQRKTLSQINQNNK